MNFKRTARRLSKFTQHMRVKEKMLRKRKVTCAKAMKRPSLWNIVIDRFSTSLLIKSAFDPFIPTALEMFMKAKMSLSAPVYPISEEYNTEFEK